MEGSVLLVDNKNVNGYNRKLANVYDQIEKLITIEGVWTFFFLYYVLNAGHPQCMNLIISKGGVLKWAKFL